MIRTILKIAMGF